MTNREDLLRRFLAAPKPSWMIPADIVVMSLLILVGDKYPGHEWMKERTGHKDARGVLTALKKLTAAGWVMFPRVNYESANYTVVESKLPKEKS